MCHIRRRLIRATKWTATAVTIALLTASPAYADAGTEQLNRILGNATAWLVGILASVATLFLTIGGIRHVMAGDDPGEIEKAKASFKSAILGYALAVLAPIVVLILKGILGVR